MDIKENLKPKLQIHYVPITDLKPADYNPRVWNEQTTKQLTESIQRYGLVDPIVANSAEARKNIVIGGHFRLHVAKSLGFTEMPVVYINIADILDYLHGKRKDGEAITGFGAKRNRRYLRYPY